MICYTISLASPLKFQKLYRFKMFAALLVANYYWHTLILSPRFFFSTIYMDPMVDTTSVRCKKQAQVYSYHMMCL